MADLLKNDPETRESWVAYAIEFALRGLRPMDIIEVHGPHGPDAPYIWGSAFVTTFEPPRPIFGRPSYEVRFRTNRIPDRQTGARARYNLSGLGFRTWDVDSDPTFSKLRLSEMTPRNRLWLGLLREEQKRLATEHKREGPRYSRQRACLEGRNTADGMDEALG
jgi:hypothetical protein